MNVIENLWCWNLVDDDGSFKLPLKTFQLVLRGNDVTSTRINENLGRSIKNNAMAHGRIKGPPNDHDCIFLDTRLVRLESLEFPGMSLKPNLA
jgi:hypothetical protein